MTPAVIFAKMDEATFDQLSFLNVAENSWGNKLADFSKIYEVLLRVNRRPVSESIQQILRP